MTSFGETIKSLRKRAGWTLDELAERTGYSRGYLSKLENDKMAGTRESTQKLAEAFALPEALLIYPDIPADRIRAVSKVLESIVHLPPHQIAAVSDLIEAFQNEEKGNP